jgi:hypothetical protein
LGNPSPHRCQKTRCIPWALTHNNKKMLKHILKHIMTIQTLKTFEDIWSQFTKLHFKSSLIPSMSGKVV